MLCEGCCVKNIGFWWNRAIKSSPGDLVRLRGGQQGLKVWRSPHLRQVGFTAGWAKKDRQVGDNRHIKHRASSLKSAVMASEHSV